MSSVEFLEALLFAVRQVNRDKVLPGVTLGVFALDDCFCSSLTLMRAIQFMPGAYTSQHSIAVARVLQLFKLPQISPTSTSDVLSDKVNFPYFLRTLPPDRDQVQALAHIVRHFNWTYVSLVYSLDPYGQNSQTKLTGILASLDVCVAQSLTLSSTMVSSDYDTLIQALRRHKQARAVLLCSDIKHVRPLMAAVERNGAYREFIWVGSDAIYNEFQYNSRACDYNLGSIAVKAHSVTPQAFIDYMVKKIHERMNDTRSDDLQPPRDSLESWVPNTEEDAQYLMAAENVSPDPMFAVAAFVIDAVYAFAHALRQLMIKNCPGARGREARACVRHHSVFDYLKNVSFVGTSGHFQFDENGDVVGTIEIRQCQQRDGWSSSQLIGMWEHKNSNLAITSAVFPDHTDGVPVSVCAQPCKLGQIYSFTRQTCCWTCVTCKPNEVTTANASGCLPCPRFEWPDEATRRRCKAITVPLTPADPVMALALQVAAVVGLMVTLVTAFTFFLYRGQRVIRSSSRELSGLMLGGLASAYILVFPLLATPSPLSCNVTHVGFGLTFTLVL
nr:hypothetical protein BaRGS_021883 [Batillaria attramentaria]